MNTYCGWLDIGEFDGEGTKSLTILKDKSMSLSQQLEKFNNKNIAVRYWISDVEDCIEDIKTNATRILMGDCTAEYCVRYSDITGYLWTDDNLNVGGHDLLRELNSFVGKYIVLEIEVNK